MSDHEHYPPVQTPSVELLPTNTVRVTVPDEPMGYDAVMRLAQELTNALYVLRREG